MYALACVHYVIYVVACPVTYCGLFVLTFCVESYLLNSAEASYLTLDCLNSCCWFDKLLANTPSFEPLQVNKGCARGFLYNTLATSCSSFFLLFRN